MPYFFRRPFGQMLLQSLCLAAKALLFWGVCAAQVPKVCIRNIELLGNRHTRAQTILGQMDFHRGDSLELGALQPSLERNKRFIYNLLLFSSVEIKIQRWEETAVDLQIVVAEYARLYPFPVFELADRNFNVWWRDFDRDLRRTNLGLWLIWRNPLGYNDFLKTAGQLGFTQKWEIDYTLPPNRLRKWGFGFNVLRSQNRELAYDTRDNQLVFYRDLESRQRQFERWRGTLELLYRPRLFDWHTLEINYLDLKIGDSIFMRNPQFFGQNRTRQQSFNLRYNFRHDRRDILAYPMHGHYLEFGFEQNGLLRRDDLHQTSASLALGFYRAWRKRWNLGLYAKGKYAFNRAWQPYYNQVALGYQLDYVRGYQYYVINGQDFGMLQTDLGYTLFDRTFPLFPEARQAYLRTLPLQVRMRYFFDLGYVRDRFYYQNNPLANSWLGGAGLGADFIFFYYKMIVQLEYTVIRGGENGLFFRFKFNF